MSNMLELHNRWRGFSAERAKARREVDHEIDANNAEIERLRLKNIELNTDFQEHWSKTKKELQEERDLAVMEAMAEGRSGQDILRELGSRNTVWIYDLRKRLAAEGRLPETVNENSPVWKLKEASEKQAKLNVSWFSHNHVGAIGWLISEGEHWVKHYDTDGDFGGGWFVCTADHKFVGGNQELFKATPESEINRKAAMLESLLDGTFKGTVMEVDNPYTD